MDGNSTQPLTDWVPFPFEIPQDCSLDQIWWFHLFTDNQIESLFHISTSQKIIITVLFPIVFFIGLVGNATFLLIVGFNRRMRTITNFYLSNLAVADILFIIVSAVVGFWNYGISHGLSLGATFYRSRIGCLTSLALVYFTYLASMILVLLVSFERFLAICYPVKYRALKSTGSKRLSAKLAAATWLVALCFSLLISPYQGKLTRVCIVWPARVRFLGYPSEIYQCKPLYPVFKDIIAFAEAVPFTVSVVVICILYGKIILVLRDHAAAGVMKDQNVPHGSGNIQIDPSGQRSAQPQNNPDGTQNPGLQNIADGQRNRKPPQDDRRKLLQTQVTRMVVANGLVYFLCLAPFQIIFILDFIWRQSGENLYSNEWAVNLILVARCLNALNSAINPIIYAIANPKYRKAFFRLIKCSSGDNNSIEPSDTGTVSTSTVNRTGNLDNVSTVDPEP